MDRDQYDEQAEQLVNDMAHVARCLYLELPEAVADDVRDKLGELVEAVAAALREQGKQIADLRAEKERLLDERDELKSKLEDAIAGGTAAAELLVEAHEQIAVLKAQLADAEKRGMGRALEFFKPYQHAVSDAIAGRIRAEMEKKS